MQSQSEKNKINVHRRGWIRLLFLVLLLFVVKQAQTQNITHIYTDFDGGWSSGVGDLNDTPTNDDSHLLGFTVGGVTYSTGVNDTLLESLHGSNNFTPAIYNALPVENLAPKSANSYVGIPYLWNGTPQLGGGNTSGFQTLPSQQLPFYLNEGTQGLNLGTAVFNISTEPHAEYPVETINPDQITNPTAPAILVTQMGDPSQSNDTFRFVDSNGNTIGNTVSVAMGGIEPVGEQVWAFFDPFTFRYSGTQPGGAPAETNTRYTRIRTFSLADFGLTESTIDDVAAFIHEPSGDSDIAFIATYIEAFSFIEADLEVNKSVNTDEPVTPGATVTFTIQVTNNGPADATQVEVQDLLPSGYTFTSATPHAGTSYNEITGIWDIGNLAHEATVTLTMEAVVLSDGTYLNTAVVSASESDPDISNNTSSATVSIADRSIAIVKSGEYVDTNEDGIVNVGDHISYTFTLTNTGQVPLTGVNVSDIRLNFQGRPTNPQTIAPGETAALTVNYELTEADIEAGFIENSATGSGLDPQGNTVSDVSGTDMDNNDPTFVYLLVANDDEYSGNGVTGEPNIGNILDNDKIGEEDITIDDVTITILSPADPGSPGSNVPEVDPATGIVSIPENTPSGTYTITYQICSEEGGLADNCDQATVTVTVSGPIIIDLTGGPCWRMLSSPTQGTTYADMLENIWTQGPPGSNHPGSSQPNIYSWDINNQAWVAPASMNTVIPAGTGFIVSVFDLDDIDDPESGGWDKVLEIPAGTEHPAPLSAPFENAGDGSWILLGNPFHSNIDTGVLGDNSSDLTSVYYVYDRTEGSGWVSTAAGYGDLEDGAIAVGQGFFVQANGANPSLNFTQDSKTEAGLFYGKEKQLRDYVRLEVRGEEISNSAWLRFSENGSLNYTFGDALKLEPMAEEYAVLASRKADGTLTDIGHYPNHNRDLVIPVSFQTSEAGRYVITASDLDLPAGLTLYFTDLNTNKTMPLDEQFEYSFTINQAAKNAPGVSGGMNLCHASPQRAKSDGRDRFVITSAPGDNLPGTGELPTHTTLEQNFPNPFNPSTIIRYNLAEAGEVQMDVYDMLGRRVATLVEGTLSAGSHTVTFDATGLNSGVYFYRLTAQNQVLSKQMILVK